MQAELLDLQPKLIETSQETEELINIIEQETIEVEDIKRIVEVDESVANKAAQEAEAIKVWVSDLLNVDLSWFTFCVFSEFAFQCSFSFVCF